jgi:hypothetical protein
VAHATHVASVIFGQPSGPVRGIAPNCRGLSISVAFDRESVLCPLSLARGIDLALNSGANLIHVGTCLPSQTGSTFDLLERAVRACVENNVLVVAPAGNDGGECWCMPAALPGVLAVGALKDDGRPFQFSNWGGIYQTQGVLAPGENIQGAAPGGGIASHKGTSCAAPVVTGVAALLMSLQVLEDGAVDAGRVRDAILESALPCDSLESHDRGRCLRGMINIPGAVERLFDRTRARPARPVGGNVRSLGGGALGASTVQAGVAPSEASGLVFALGNVGFDFATEARRDTFKQQMPPVLTAQGTPVPPNPYDVRQLVSYLKQNPSEAKELIWTLNLELTPVYAIEPCGPYGEEVYRTLVELLDSQSVSPSDLAYVNRVSVPGVLTGDTVKLFSGQTVPGVAVDSKRGVHGWQVNQVIKAALEVVTSVIPPEKLATVKAQVIGAVTSFLNRIYYEYRNLGVTSPERALNFAVTNIVQTAVSFALALSAGKELGTIDVKKSPYCRLDSDCWDVQLKFFDPENIHRSWTVLRFAVDVSDKLPVTLGDVVQWEAAVLSA